MTPEQDTRLIHLAWAIIELKISYYRPDLIHPSWSAVVSQSDAFYDSLEDEYRLLCKLNGAEPSAADMVGVDLEKPSCRLAVNMLSQPKNNNKASVEHFLRKTK